MYCNKCGTQNPEGASFCIKCGNILSLKTEIERNGITGELGKMGILGFRSGKTWKMVLATLIYFCVTFVGSAISAAFIFGMGTHTETPTPTTSETPSPTPEIRYVYVTPQPTTLPPPTLPADALNSLQGARNDFSWRLDLNNEQQRRLDTLYETKAGVTMNQQEFKGWIEAIRTATDEYSIRANNALYSGENYRTLLNAYESSLNADYYNSEKAWINKNRDITTSDLNGNIANLNSDINKYNNCFVYKTGC
ncbi:MAG: zinc ribbon domain-containing protein [Candidatus Methanoperedens sp.]|nr:zinc ribbon domain-containing protein [Candidatus Methanoperedens sp.]